MVTRNTTQHQLPDFSAYTSINPGESDSLLAEIALVQWSQVERDQQISSLVTMMDLTTLDSSDTPEKVQALCQKGSHPHPDLAAVAAICVYPNFVRDAKKALEGTGVLVASVAGAFPSGQTDLSIKLAEVQYALDEGADEIDMVISRGKLKSALFTEVFDEIAAIREKCSAARLKVILETGELSMDQIRIASDIALYAGGDFIKTSTGKIPVGATLPAAAIMLSAIRDYQTATGIQAGFKASGGVSTVEAALPYLNLGQHLLGHEWMNKDWFRFGASSLLDDVLKSL